MKKYLIIPDVHGHTYWEQFVKDYGDKVDKIIFLGDYCDSYRDVTREDEVLNFANIITYKNAHKDKVELLLGNHDINQYILDEPCSRKASGLSFELINDLLTHNIDIFNVVYKTDNWVISHAGITQTWWKDNNIQSIEDINKRFHNGEYKLFKWNGPSWDIYGEAPQQGPTWIRPETLFKEPQFPKQIVGHSRIDDNICNTLFKDDKKGIHIIVTETGPQDKYYILED